MLIKGIIMRYARVIDCICQESAAVRGAVNNRVVIKKRYFSFRWNKKYIPTNTKIYSTAVMGEIPPLPNLRFASP